MVTGLLYHRDVLYELYSASSQKLCFTGVWAVRSVTSNPEIVHLLRRGAILLPAFGCMPPIFPAFFVAPSCNRMGKALARCLPPLLKRSRAPAVRQMPVAFKAGGGLKSESQGCVTAVTW